MFILRIDVCTVLIILTLLASLAAAGEHSRRNLSVHADLSYAHLDKAFQLTDATGFGGGVVYSFTPAIAIGLELNRTQTQRHFDLIGAVGNFDLTFNTISLTILHRIVNFSKMLNLSLKGGIGMLHQRQESHRIDLGALGDVQLPAESNLSAMFSVGTVLKQKLNNVIALHVMPELQFSRISGMKTNFYLKGGINVNVL